MCICVTIGVELVIQTQLVWDDDNGTYLPTLCYILLSLSIVLHSKCVAYVTVLHILTAQYNMSIRSHTQAHSQRHENTPVCLIGRFVCVWVKTHMRYTQASTILSMTLGLKWEPVVSKITFLHIHTAWSSNTRTLHKRKKKKARENKKVFHWICS